MKQLEDMKGICKYCIGCLRLENENFHSRYRCKDFDANQMNWKDLIEKELLNEQVQKQKNSSR